MLYDYIIIGGGISGLYSAYNIKKNNPSAKFIIFEKNKTIGGRMNIYNFYGTNVNIGAGVGRKNKDYLLINLLNELNVKYSIDKKMIYYYKNVEKIDFNKIVKTLKNSYDKNKHITYTFRKFGIEILGKELYNKFVTYLGYSDYENADAFESLNYYGLDDDIGNSEVLYIKWDKLLNSISNNIGNNNIITNNNIISINKVDDKFIIKNDKGKIYYSNKIIIATTIDTLSKLLPKLTIYNNIKGQIFLRAYGKFDDNSANIINNIIKGYTIVNGPIKKIIPINKETGIYMIAYTDNKGAKYFNNHLKDKKFFCREIEKALGLYENTLKLIGIKCFYWNIGTHYYKPLSKKYNSRKEFIEKCQNPEKNLFVVGELISRNQGWSQGALESVNNIIKYV
jgi:thioredoxin reductase